MSIQQLMLGVGASKKTYIDDVFSTYLWTGSGSDQTINTGLDMAGQGGMVWVKNRSSSVNHALVDTVRGAGYFLESNTSDANYDYPITGANPRNLNSFTSTGFTLKSDDGNQFFNWPTGDPKYTSFSFLKAKGFFDVVTYTGNGTSGRTVSHNLGCIPGLMLVKRTSDSEDWEVYHRSLGATKDMRLNTNAAAYTSAARWNDTEPTASVFTLGNDLAVNGDGSTYVAYLFGGGESTAATARSVNFASGEKLSWSANNDFHLTGDFTIEYWIRPTSYSNKHIYAIGDYSAAYGHISYFYNDKWYIQTRDSNGTGTDHLVADGVETPPKGQWSHCAVVRSGSTVSAYINGALKKTFTNSDDFGSASNKEFYVGSSHSGSSAEADISNFRIVKGTAVYTSSFRPPTEPLTNITNTKLLCCNNSSTTGSTVTPGTITASGSPTASTDSPFDDPAGFKFGDSKEGIIKCGSYVGADASTEVNLGFEPQLLLIKKTSGTGDWHIFDSMRGMVDGGNDAYVYPNGSWQEDNTNVLKVTPTGFKFEVTTSAMNGSGADFIYLAIRRPDGYVGKPADAGTGVFAMDTGSDSSTIPNFDSGFPVDFQIMRTPASTGYWYTGARLTGTKYMATNNTDDEASSNSWVWDSNVGCLNGYDSTYQSWMWKRHAGFDVVTYDGNGTAGHQISHSLNKIPEMMWVKRRDGTASWTVYHKGLDNGTNPETHYLLLDTDDAEGDGDSLWNDAAPTSTHFTLGNSSYVNSDWSGASYIAMLFASVNGISKVGSYTGNGNALGNSPVEITTGFQPRFIIIKRLDAAGNWRVFDTLRGINISSLGGDNDSQLNLNDNSAADTSYDWIDVTSTSFKVTNFPSVGNSGSSYIYYAHA